MYAYVSTHAHYIYSSVVKNNKYLTLWTDLILRYKKQSSQVENLPEAVWNKGYDMKNHVTFKNYILWIAEKFHRAHGCTPHNMLDREINSSFQHIQRQAMEQESSQLFCSSQHMKQIIIH